MVDFDERERKLEENDNVNKKIVDALVGLREMVELDRLRLISLEKKFTQYDKDLQTLSFNYIFLIKTLEAHGIRLK